jgi:hypothetical protein
MPNPEPEAVELDFTGAERVRDLLENLSTVAATGEFLWAAGDEGRTVECLKAIGDQFQLCQQVKLDAVLTDLPGSEKDENDIESIDIAKGRLWLCSSHARVRRKPKRDGELDPSFFLRPSQCLFGSIELTGHGGELLESGQTLPFAGTGSLRNLLSGDDYLASFAPLPSKENGLDIEGMAVIDGRAFFGLRGPLIDGHAVVVEVAVAAGLSLDNRAYHLHFLDLGGLGIRDLARIADNDLLVLAGPVGRESGPYHVSQWTPQRTVKIQSPGPLILDDWTEGDEKPEGMCCLERDGTAGLLIVYDSPDKRRINGTVYQADWFPL